MVLEIASVHDIVKIIHCLTLYAKRQIIAKGKVLCQTFIKLLVSLINTGNCFSSHLSKFFCRVEDGPFMRGRTMVRWPRNRLKVNMQESQKEN